MDVKQMTEAEALTNYGNARRNVARAESDHAKCGAEHAKAGQLLDAAREELKKHDAALKAVYVAQAAPAPQAQPATAPQTPSQEIAT